MIAKNTCPNSSFKYQKYLLIIFFKSTKYLPKIFTNYQNDPTKLYFNNNFIGQTNSNWDTWYEIFFQGLQNEYLKQAIWNHFEKSYEFPMLPS